MPALYGWLIESTTLNRPVMVPQGSPRGDAADTPIVGRVDHR
jgi:hypothetical protein